MEDNWKYEYLIEQIHRTAYKKHVSFVIGSLIHDKSLSELKPCTQYYVKRKDGGYALLDLYYPQIELAVEIDEPHHLNNIDSDKKRQGLVEEDLQCEFFRVSVGSQGIQSQISELKDRIRQKILSRKAQDKFPSWIEPRRLDIFTAKKEFRNTLFLKIKGEIHPNDLMQRQTGYWRIAPKKRSRIHQVVVVHNLVVSRIFRDIEWLSDPSNPQKVGYQGKETDSDELVGTIIENWRWQQTVTYSDDVY
ncbi:MAG: AbaSI family restriction endonuclease [Cyanophyceae cyanobacterium]